MQNHRIWDSVIDNVTKKDSQTIEKIIGSSNQGKTLEKSFRHALVSIHWSDKHNVKIKDNQDDMRATFKQIVRRKGA